MHDGLFFQTTFSTPAETADFATVLALALLPGDTVLLEGPIGAGKSHFARAAIQARLAKANRFEHVPSPTFTLVQTYDDGVCELWHADLYRLNGPADIDDLGLWDVFDTAICLIEWPDRLGNLAPETALTLSLEQTETAGHRRATFTATSPVWQARFKQAGLLNEV